MGAKVATAKKMEICATFLPLDTILYSPKGVKFFWKFSLNVVPSGEGNVLISADDRLK